MNPTTHDRIRTPARRWSKWTIAAALGVIFTVAVAPLLFGAAEWTAQRRAASGLQQMAVERLRETWPHFNAAGAPPEPMPFSLEVVNLPTAEDDARIRFRVGCLSGDACVLARGRVDGGEWILTYLEFQPTFGPWLVDGELGGFDAVGQATPRLPIRGAENSSALATE